MNKTMLEKMSTVIDVCDLSTAECIETARIMLDSLGKKRYFKKVVSIPPLKTLQALVHLCADYPDCSFDDYSLTPQGVLLVGYFEEGKQRGLTGKPLLDFINLMMREFVDRMREITRKDFGFEGASYVST